MPITLLAILVSLVVLAGCAVTPTGPEGPAAGPPAAPSNLFAWVVSASQIDMNWVDNSDNETGFRIERKTGAGGTYSEIATVGANVTNYSNTGLSPNTTYYYRVRAFNNDGNSSYSNEAFATTSHDAASLTQRGWAQYEAHNYSAAIDTFTLAIGMDINYADAYNGRGWSYAKLSEPAADTTKLNNAMINFNSAISKDPGLLDAYAGKVFVARLLGDFATVINTATAPTTPTAVMTSWVFAHETAINYRDVRLVLAESYYHQEDYFSAQAQVDFLNPGNGLDPYNSATWWVSGVHYNTYEEALLKEIERLLVSEMPP